MKYKKNCLKLVLLKIDFNEVELTGLEQFKEEIKKRFPNFKKKEGEEGKIEFNIKTKEVLSESQNTDLWFFSDKKETTTVRITSKSLYIQYDTYKDKEELFSDVEKVVASFISKMQIKTINRIGLRYINKITINEKKKIKWEEYLNSQLLETPSFAKKNNKTIARAMNLLVLKESHGLINFTFGFWNDIYPEETNEKEFTLDYDYYSIFPIFLEENNIIDIVKIYNEAISSLFELSIKQKFRTYLNK